MNRALKKILTAVFAAFVLVTGVLADETVFDIPETVEIAFNVGDDTLVINGEAVVTETAPYVVETATGGVTLVPVRVITEAFGAVVGWEEATQTVTLDYPDVKIVLQIGNPVAEVNGEAVTLLTAPELPGGRTMVPLRFISEAFGAEVGYDDATQAITVLKTTIEEGNMVEGSIETEYVGDSYLGWSMKNPRDLYLDIFSNGMYIEFYDDDYNFIDIYVDEKYLDYTLEEEFEVIKETIAEYGTLVKADMNAEKQMMHFCYREDELYCEDIYYVTDKYIINVYSCVENTEELVNKFSELTASFVPVFLKDEDIHDLSDIVDGMRKFEEETMNFTLMLPANLSGGAVGGKLDTYSFSAIDNSNSNVILEIVSVSEAVATPEKILEYSREMVEKFANKDLVKFSKISEIDLGTIKAYEMTMTVSGSASGDCKSSAVCFELGDYQYRFTIQIAADENPDETIAQIIEKSVFNTIDSESVGLIIDMLEMEESESSEAKFGFHTITIPGELIDAYEGMVYIDKYNRYNLIMVTEVMPAGITLDMIIGQLPALLDSLVGSTEGAGITLDTEKITIFTVGGIEFYALKATQTRDANNLTAYQDIYIGVKDGLMYLAVFTTTEMYYSDATLEVFDEIISSLKPIE